MRRPVPPNLRALLFQRSTGRCERAVEGERCATVLTLETFHAAHLVSVKSGGATVLENLEAWCRRCNLTNGAQDVRDPRITPRPWQLQGLTTDPTIPDRIRHRGVATVAAAPGAGKTLFAGLVFQDLQALGHVERLVVFTPRDALVHQWAEALRRDCFLELSEGQAHERSGTIGTVVTYQSLNPDSVDVHQRQARAQRTLLVFDEVHHLGEPARDTGQRPAWARYAMDIAGEIGALRVTGVLNLSGTLWRSDRGERISTVEYREDAGRLVSDVDLEITATELIERGELRPVDLFRVDATVHVVDLSTATQTISAIADLDDPGPARAAIAQLPRDAGWRETFTAAVLDRLETAYRSLGGRAPVKALIIASRQQDARDFQATANALMKARGLQPFTELAVSDDGPDAARTLRRFKRQQTPGVLCTVNMAGEGYDCPEIIVVGFATNKLTPLYVRQVVARAQRVTQYERTQLGRPLPAAIIIPNVEDVVQHMTNILMPMRHEIEHRDADDRVRSGQTFTLPRYVLSGVEETRDGDARVTGVQDGDVDREMIRRLEPHLRRVKLPESEAARMLVATRAAAREAQAAQPFDPLRPEDQHLASAPPTRARTGGARVEPAYTETAAHWQAALHALERWWAKHGAGPIRDFGADVNRAGGIPSGGRPQASVAQLTRAYHYARLRVQQHCQTTGRAMPPAAELAE